MEEAITSSQLEGAVTTREMAKEMIRTGRAPRDTSEQMILNNFITMRRIAEVKDEALTPELVYDLHRLVTEKTLKDPTAAGRPRRSDEKCVVADWEGDVYHEPPAAGELEHRIKVMCDFANGKTPDYFIHPAVRAIICTFGWLTITLLSTAMAEPRGHFFIGPCCIRDSGCSSSFRSQTFY